MAIARKQACKMATRMAQAQNRPTRPTTPGSKGRKKDSQQEEETVPVRNPSNKKGAWSD